MSNMADADVLSCHMFENKVNESEVLAFQRSTCHVTRV